MKEIFKTKAFWIIFLLASFVITAAFFNLKKTFQSEIDFMIIPQNEISVKNSSQIISNLSALPKNLSFFEKIIQENEDLLDEGIGELPNYEKKKYWDEKIKTDNFKETGIIRITIKDRQRFQIENLTEQVTNNFIKYIGVYYDIKKDIDVRLVEDPIFQETFTQPFWVIILEGFLTGFLISFFSFYLSFSFLTKNQKDEKKLIKREFFQAHLNQNEKPLFETRFVKNESDGMKPWILAETAKEENYFSGFLKKAMAPDNLPVAPEEPKKERKKIEQKKELISKSFLDNDKIKQQVFSISKSKHLSPQIFSNENLSVFEDEKEKDLSLTSILEEEKTEEPKTHEPTEKEVKERLNKLLSGKKI